MKKPLLLALFTIHCSLFTFGQSPSPTPEYSESADATIAVKPPKLNEKPRSLDEIKSLIKANKTKDDLILAYDKFKDESIIMSKPENLVGSWEGVAAIMASSPMGSRGPSTPRILMVGIEWRFAGTTLRETPARFVLFFDGMSPDWQFLKTGETLYVLFDGDKRMQLQAAATDHDIVRYNRVDEKVAYVITREQIASLAASTTKVEIRIGNATPANLSQRY